MEILTHHVYSLIANAVKIHGSYNPNEISYLFEESLTFEQWDAVVPFLWWCHRHGKTFGYGNYNEKYQEYIQHKTP